jgi:hypothetical protein
MSNSSNTRNTGVRTTGLPDTSIISPEQGDESAQENFAAGEAVANTPDPDAVNRNLAGFPFAKPYDPSASPAPESLQASAIQAIQQDAPPMAGGAMARSANVPVYSAAAEPEMVEVFVLDDQLDTYVKKKIPLHIAASDMRESWEGVGALGLDTSMYDQDLHYTWVVKDPEHPGTVDARGKGYAPVREASGKMHATRKMTDGSWGNSPVVVFGDLVLMACPRMRVEAREADRLRRQRDERDEMLNSGLSKDLKNIEGNRRGVDVFHKEWRTDVYRDVVASADNDRAMGQAEAFARASMYDKTEAGRAMAEDIAARAGQEEYAASVERANRGSSTYGGFNGPMGRGIPDSPTIAKIKAAMAVQDAGLSAQALNPQGQMSR